MWRKIGGWKFCCGCDWTVLEKEGQKDPNGDNPVSAWYIYMKEKHTANVDCWPKVGCGARFIPWGRGASM
eukprot:12912888-Prorocentrum_lima.AAC.1